MSLLSKATSGIVKKPHYVLLHGVPGIGKSTFAADAPKPIFLCAEQGTNHLNVTRLELSSFDEFMVAIKELYSSDHDFKTVVIDTVDHLEPLIQKKVGDDEGKQFEKIGYGKGPEYALPYWHDLMNGLEALRDKKNMNIILLAHTEVKRFNDPALTEGYDRYQVKLNPKAAAILVDHVEDVLFATYKTFLHKKEGEKNRGMGDGSRVMYTGNRPAYTAKTRFSLPHEMPLSFEDYVVAKETPATKAPDDLLANINELLKAVKDAAMKEKITKHVATIKENVAELAKVENKLRTVVSAA